MIIPLITGIFLGYTCMQDATRDAAIVLALVSLLAFSFLIVSYKRLSLYRCRWLVGSLLHVFIFLGGYWLTVSFSEKFDDTHYSRQKAEALLVVVKSEPRSSGHILRFESEARESYDLGEKSPSTGKIMISVQADSTGNFDLRYGDVILVPASYNPVEPPYNPGEFDYCSYLAKRQIYYQAFLKQDQVFTIKRNEGNVLIAFALCLRKQLVNKFNEYLRDKDAAAFASTLILGYRAELSRELVEAYSKTGTMHVLSVSGMHVGIVFMVLSALLKFMDRTSRTRLIRAILIILAIWFYAMISGFSAPASRAAVMLSFIVLGKALNRHQNTYNLIAISAFFLLLYNPFYLVDAGFQLSYLAVTGLAYFHPRIYRALYVRNRLLDHIWSYSALSVAAQLATFPVSIYYFHQFPLYFLLSNLFIVVPVAVIMYAGIIFMFLPGSILLFYLGIALSWLISFTNNILYVLENLPLSSWDGIWISTLECILIGLALIFMSLQILKKSDKLIFPAIFLIVILCISFNVRWLANSKLNQIIFYALRKNTAIAYISDHRSVIISDLDKSDNAMGFSVMPAVKSRGSECERFHHSGDTFEDDSYAIAPNFYQFADYRILRWNKNLDKLCFSTILKIDAVLISGSPNTTVENIRASLRFNRLIIEANNPDYKVKKWVSEAKLLNLRCDVLKRRGALVIDL
ncbi:MAG: ComEC/Rec2 family competence protein [Daejeonella sp.]